MSAIKIKTKKMSAKHVSDHLWLYNYVKTIYPEAELDTYIKTYKRQLLSVIENNPKWGNGTKEMLYFVVGRYLHNLGDRYAETFTSHGHDKLLISKEQEGENQLDEKEKQFYRDHDYFINVLDNIDTDTLQTKTAHYKYLLLSMLTLQPPIRTSFYTSAKIIRSKADNNGTDNYILINRRGKVKVSYIVNKDKASNYKLYNMNKNLSKIDLDNEALQILINESFNKYPREYIFENNEGKPVSQGTILNWLRDITKLSGVTIDIMRASYITYFYTENLNFNAREKLSKVMRHSQMTASRNYNKVFDKEDEPEKLIDCNKVNEALQLQIIELQEKLNALTNTKIINETVAETPTAESRHYKKKRSDIIYNLNKKGRSPREDTLKIYNITYDEKKLYTYNVINSLII